VVLSRAKPTTRFHPSMPLLKSLEKALAGPGGGVVVADGRLIRPRDRQSAVLRTVTEVVTGRPSTTSARRRAPSLLRAQ
jgi:hypothetical protein